jgi:hypothetical protein
MKGTGLPTRVKDEETHPQKKRKKSEKVYKYKKKKDR